MDSEIESLDLTQLKPMNMPQIEFPKLKESNAFLSMKAHDINNVDDDEISGDMMFSCFS